MSPAKGTSNLAAILGVFARAVNIRQAIVRIECGQLAATSFQPRPFAANWNRDHALSPGALAHPMTDPLDLTSLRPTVSTSDMIRLAGKTAMAVAGVVSNGAQADGTVTFEFATAPGNLPAVRVPTSRRMLPIRSLHMTKCCGITNEMRGPSRPRVSTQFCGLINLNSPTA